jgi:hypothetical protein
VLSADAATLPAYFWRVADGNYEVHPVAGDWADLAYHERWLTGSGKNASPVRGCRWCVDAEAKYPPNLEEKTPCRKGHLQEWDTKMMYTAGNRWLAIEGIEPAKMLPQGLGYWRLSRVASRVRVSTNRMLLSSGSLLKAILRAVGSVFGPYT